MNNYFSICTKQSWFTSGHSCLVTASALLPWTALAAQEEVPERSVPPLENRLLTGDVTIDAGRHIVGLVPIGSLTLNGGDFLESEATTLQVNSGGFAQLANGIRLSSASDFTFNGSSQNHALGVAYNGPIGRYSIQTSLLGAGSAGVEYTDTDGNLRQDFGGQWSTSAEYGTVFGATTTFNFNSRSNYPLDERVYPLLGEQPFTSTSFVFERELASTPQPSVASEVRSIDADSGIRTDLVLARGAGILMNERISPLIVGEASAVGSSLDLSGVTLDVSGTAVVNRQIGGGVIDLGRRIVGTPDEMIQRSDALTLSTFRDDDQATRLNLESFNNTANGLEITHGEASAFDSATSIAEVQVEANFNLSSSEQGLNTNTFNGAVHLTGEGLEGETVQGSLSIGYQWNAVGNNELDARDNLVIVNEGDGVTAQTIVGSRFSTETHTDITFDRADARVAVSGNLAGGQLHNLGTRTVEAIAEGLAGEDTTGASDTFTTYVASLSAAEVGVSTTAEGGNALVDGDSITVQDNGSGIYQRNAVLSGVEISGGDSLDYELDVTGSANIAHGQSTSLGLRYVGDTSTPADGSLDRISRAELSLSLSDTFSVDAIRQASGTSQQRRFEQLLEP